MRNTNLKVNKRVSNYSIKTLDSLKNQFGFVCFEDKASYQKYIKKYLGKEKIEIGRGHEGIVYKTRDKGIVYKEYGNVAFYIGNQLYKDPSKIIRYDEVSPPNNTIYFPINLFYIKNHKEEEDNQRAIEELGINNVSLVIYMNNSVKEFLGYTSFEFVGDKLCNKNNPSDSIDFSNIRDAYEEVMEDVIYLGKRGISLPDITYNILYNEKQFGIVDTIDYGGDESKIALDAKRFNEDDEKLNAYLVHKAICIEISEYTGDDYTNCQNIDELISCIKSNNNGSMTVYRMTLEEKQRRRQEQEKGKQK